MKKKATASEQLTFSGYDHRNKKATTNRDLKSELYSKNWAAQKIDSYERSVLGIRGQEQAKPNLKYSSRMLQPEYEEDSRRLDDLMNDPKYSIVYTKDNWTIEGKYVIFVIYSENLDHVRADDIDDEELDSNT